jgi:ribose transport system permease protein
VAVSEHAAVLARGASATAAAAARRFVGSRVFLLVVLNGAFVLGVSFATPYFATGPNFRVMIAGSAMEFVMTAVMAFLLVARMFDLSVDGTVNMTGVVAGILMTHGAAVPLAILTGLAIGAAVGAVNGVAVTKLRMNPLMTTLGTWWIGQGVAYGLTVGISPHLFPSAFVRIGGGMLGGIDTPLWYLIVLVPIAAWVLARTRFGYHVYATGGDAEASRLRGVKIDRVVIACFVAMGLASALAGLVYAARLNAATPIAVSGANLRVIAGAVIGGCSLSGGRGSVVGAMLGILFMTMLTNATVILGFNPYWQYTILGGVIFAAVAADALANRKRV